jgi:hypothetical protein
MSFLLVRREDDIRVHMVETVMSGRMPGINNYPVDVFRYFVKLPNEYKSNIRRLTTACQMVGGEKSAAKRRE